MEEQVKTTGTQKANPTARTALNPRDVATIVMARMNMVNTKKDELTIAIKGLSDLTQQLARAYAEQMQVLEGLGQRVRVLEGAGTGRNGASGNGAVPPAAEPGQRPE